MVQQDTCANPITGLDVW